jgi:hypothetical protein
MALYGYHIDCLKPFTLLALYNKRNAKIIGSKA